ncbi:MAG: uroporphyrinogen-III synthase [SAR324 cluster bacterium]|nr:uroporphyrinogen-III synthase [SAR324 cluster bacterium]MBL7036091.1 uroporphyrinogen-III synthase [SAR324 cluster bacterium]
MKSVKVQLAEKLPLAGLRFLVTRQDSPEISLTKMLQTQGASVLTAQMTQIVAPVSWESFDAATLQVSKIDWAIFSSRNGVHHCQKRLNELGLLTQIIFSNIKTACIGQATATALSDLGITPELVPEHFQSEGLISAFGQYDLHKKLCWLIQAESARKILPAALEKAGAQLITTPVYRNIPETRDYSFLLTELEDNKLDWVLFASPSAVNNFHNVIPAGFWSSLTIVPKIACLGEITAAAVRHFGWNVEAQPDIQDFEHLVKMLCKIKSDNINSR